MKIFNKLKINKIILKNKICIAPMCQYSAKNGNPTNWHYAHLEKLMNAGAGLVMIESTAVSKQGMITNQDLSLKSNENVKKLTRLIKYIRQVSNTKIGIFKYLLFMILIALFSITPQYLVRLNGRTANDCNSNGVLDVLASIDSTL